VYLDIKRWRKSWEPLRKLLDGEGHRLYVSRNIIRVIGSRSVRWVGHTFHKGTVYIVLFGSLEGKTKTQMGV
jgi:hypothetical protein